MLNVGFMRKCSGVILLYAESLDIYIYIYCVCTYIYIYIFIYLCKFYISP